MSLRPRIFEEMGPQFAEALGNCDAIFSVSGAVLPATRGILRRWREIDQMEQEGQPVEGTSHLLSVAAAAVPGLASQRDTVTIFMTNESGARIDAGKTFEIKNHSDDARAMLRIYLSGDI